MVGTLIDTKKHYVGVLFAFALFGLTLQTSSAQQPPSVPLYTLVDAQSRSISPENRTGGKGMGAQTELENGSAREAAKNLGKGWKVNPYLDIAAGATLILGEADGPGIINHIWMTLGGAGDYRSALLRVYWDDEAQPSVETPAGDFFASGWGKGNEPIINSAVVAVNPGSGFNSFWQMPFRKHFRIAMENRSTKTLRIYYQIDYSLQAVANNAAYFHAQFRQVPRLTVGQAFTIVDGIKGQGHYVGTYLTHAALSPGWWGEGEVKFYMDGDTEFPTIAGTGEEDYFLGAYSYFKQKPDGKIREINFSSHYSGFYALHEANEAEYFARDGERRYGEYRWHILDPIRFKRDLKVTIQSLGWEGASLTALIGNRTYRALDDRLSAVAYWYQTEPHASFPALPSDAELAIPPLRSAQ
jgi:hypothetical protein